MVLLDDHRRHVDMNGAYLQLLGYSRGSLIGRSIHVVRPPGTAWSRREWEAALRQRQLTGTADFVCADGRLLMAEFAGHPEVVTGQQLVLFVGLRVSRPGRLSVTGMDDQAQSESLSARERDVIELVASGLEGPEIARELEIAHNTVRTHVRNAMKKLRARSRAHMVAIFLGDGLFRR